MTTETSTIVDMHLMEPKQFVDLWKRVWGHVAYELKAMLSLDESSYGILKRSGVAELAASIPFRAGCRNPMRKAYYITLPLVADAVGHDILDATEQDYRDDVTRRLEEIGNVCACGDRELVAQGLNRLAACMYWDCLQDLELDGVLGKQSPKREYAMQALEKLKAARNPDPVYDAIMPTTDVGWWWPE